MKKILIIGYGDIGKNIAFNMSSLGHQVVSLKRTATNDKNIIFADITKFEEIRKIDNSFDEVVIIISPSGRDEKAYCNVFDVALTNILKHFKNKTSFTFISSTVVYTQSFGEWVDEETPINPQNFRSKIIHQAETKILKSNPQSIVIRFSGIYGRGSDYLINKIKTSDAIQYQPPYYTNRIHIDDCINSIIFILQKKFNKELKHRVYNATESYPIPLFKLLSYIAKKNNLAMPKKEILEDNVNQNKRICNGRLIRLGFEFKRMRERLKFCVSPQL